jgi:hypothetical protein
MFHLLRASRRHEHESSKNTCALSSRKLMESTPPACTSPTSPPCVTLFTVHSTQWQCPLTCRCRCKGSCRCVRASFQHHGLVQRRLNAPHRSPDTTHFLWIQEAENVVQLEVALEDARGECCLWPTLTNKEWVHELKLQMRVAVLWHKELEGDLWYYIRSGGGEIDII